MMGAQGEHRRQGLYADPMLYDILHTPNTAREVTALERVERTFARRPPAARRLWFEPASGTGRYLRVAAGRGRRVAGFDRDPGQVAYARRRVPDTFVADMRDFADAALEAGFPPGCADFAFNPVNSIRHLADDAEMRAHLAQMAAILKPGALYVVGISLTDYDWLFEDEDLWEGARGRCRVSQLVNYLPPVPGTERARVETVISHLTVTRPWGQEHFDDRYDLRTYSRREWDALIAASALDHAGSCDAFGYPLGERVLPYQLEVLVRK